MLIISSWHIFFKHSECRFNVSLKDDLTRFISMWTIDSTNYIVLNIFPVKKMCNRVFNFVISGIVKFTVI